MGLTVRQKIEAIQEGRKIRLNFWKKGQFIRWDGEMLFYDNNNKYHLPFWLGSFFDQEHPDFDKWEYYKEKTCDKCNGSGKI